MAAQLAAKGSVATRDNALDEERHAVEVEARQRAGIAVT
jgi:hypothetical protein